MLYPREGHGFREEKHQLDVLNRIIDWSRRAPEEMSISRKAGGDEVSASATGV